MAEENAVLMYKGRPLMRKDNMIYYGSMADSHIVMLQILDSKKVGDMDVATRVAVQLQLTDPAARSRDRVVKKSEKDGLYAALDVGCVWLERALAGKYKIFGELLLPFSTPIWVNPFLTEEIYEVKPQSSRRPAGTGSAAGRDSDESIRCRNHYLRHRICKRFFFEAAFRDQHPSPRPGNRRQG